MARVKRGVVSRRRHNKLLELTKGQRATRHKLVRRAHEAMVHSLNYAYFHRRERKGDMRRIWIARINAAARANGVSYSQLIFSMDAAGIELTGNCWQIWQLKIPALLPIWLKQPLKQNNWIISNLKFD